MMRVFEAEKAQARAATKGMIFMREEGSEGGGEAQVPGLEGAAWWLHEAGIKQKC